MNQFTAPHISPLINSLPLLTLPSPPLPTLFDLLRHPHLPSLFPLSSPLPHHLTSCHTSHSLPSPSLSSPLLSLPLPSPTPPLSLPSPSSLPSSAPPLALPPPSPLPSPSFPFLSSALQFLKTALHYAAEHSQLDVIRVLVRDYHASVETWDAVSFC